jgi:hypothetical protein
MLPLALAQGLLMIRNVDQLPKAIQPIEPPRAFAHQTT